MALIESILRAGTEIRVQTERPEVSLSVSEMDKGSWLMFELPGFANAASGTELGSLDALRSASETSYFRDENALWVKLVVPEDPVLPIRSANTQASITISR
jgi:cell migration-inducing and hyaluronan-binding protein